MSEGTGYKRPPAASRWKKGQSGNPRGREKGTLNLRTDLMAELGEVIKINEGGASRRITKQRAMLKSITARAINGDTKAANLLLTLLAKLFEPEQVSGSAMPIDAEDERILAAYVARALKDLTEKS